MNCVIVRQIHICYILKTRWQFFIENQSKYILIVGKIISIANIRYYCYVIIFIIGVRKRIIFILLKQQSRWSLRRGDKFDRSMTRGQLLDNDMQLWDHFYFYSNNDPTSPKRPRKQTLQNQFSERHYSEKNSYNPLHDRKLGIIGE